VREKKKTRKHLILKHRKRQCFACACVPAEKRCVLAELVCEALVRALSAATALANVGKVKAFALAQLRLNALPADLLLW
jgi:hypothetical protein